MVVSDCQHLMEMMYAMIHHDDAYENGDGTRESDCGCRGTTTLLRLITLTMNKALNVMQWYYRVTATPRKPWNCNEASVAVIASSW